MKKYSFLFLIRGALLLIPVVTLALCQNFLKGTDTKNELEKRITYANAPSYEIRVDSNSRGVVKSPAGGIVEKKVTDTFELTFEPLADYEFLKWTIIDSNSKKELENGLYLKLASTTEASTTCTLVKAPEKDMALCLCPVVVKRPRIISAAPQNSDVGAYRDAKIRVIFDKNVEENSIYFTEAEVKAKISELGIERSAFLNAGTQDAPKYYGYTYEDTIYFKNIQIEDQKTGNSLLEYYGAPYFEDAVTLVIPPGNTPVLSNTNIIVTLETGFFYKEESKDIKLKEEYKWLYFVNSKTDKDLPDIKTEIIKNNNGVPLTVNQNSPVATNKKIQMYINLFDRGSGPYGQFELELKRTGGSFTKTFKMSFDEVENENAYFGKSQTELEEIELSGVPSGVYKLNLIYYDKNLNTVTSSDYYVNVDITAPTVSNLTSSSYDDAASAAIKKTALKFDYTCTAQDLKEVKVQYIDSGDEVNLTFAKVQTIVIPELTFDSNYTFVLYFYDEVGNYCTITRNEYIKPTAVKNLTATSTVNSNNMTATVHLSWNKPDGEFNSYSISYSGNGVNRTFNNLDENILSFDISNIIVNEDYTFTVKTITAKNPGAASVTHTVMPEISIANIWVQNDKTDYLFVSSNVGRFKNSTATLYYNKTQTDVKKDNSLTVELTGSGASFRIGSDTTNKVLIGNPNQPNYGETWYYAIKLTCNGQTIWSDVKQFTITCIKDLVASITVTNGVQLYWSYSGTSNLSKIEIYINEELKESINENDYNLNTTRYCNIYELAANTTYTAKVMLTWNGVVSETRITFATLNCQSGFTLLKNENVSSPYQNSIFLTAALPNGVETSVLYYRETGSVSQSWNQIVPGLVNTWTITGLDSNKEYDVVVALYGGGGPIYEDFITTKPW
ncbi:MAG: fibronectin type III domain-containing protein [Treponema sp.]|nr:fibronectin type III domain-containing protein [Treponema sp.]